MDSMSLVNCLPVGHFVPGQNLNDRIDFSDDANMDFREFADAVDPDGIFRGFPGG
jgi:hypothetical protein